MGKEYICGEWDAPEFNDTRRDQRKFFCKKIASYPEDCKIKKAYMDDDLDKDKLLEIYTYYKKSRHYRYGDIICCSRQVEKGASGFRKITIERELPQACPNDIYKELGTKREWKDRELRVAVLNNERYIVPKPPCPHTWHHHK